jgi:AraC-like DNA-binding protein
MRQIRGAVNVMDAAPSLPPGVPAFDDAALREPLKAFLAAAGTGRLTVHVPERLGEPTPRGEGHFHLVPELFLQVSGWTVFNVPGGTCRLRAGEALVMPPQLRHAERVGADGRAREQAFRNLVIVADGPLLRCHLALELNPGRPRVAHLHSQPHLQAGMVHDWLCDAARLGAADAFAQAQTRALVAAAVAGVLRSLDAQPASASREPPLVARARVLIHNQLGDPQLSVARLASQLGCSADHLSQLFRQRAGEPLLAYINRLRVERAARLLRETSLAGKEVAWACGFAAPSYFIRVFRQHHGMTPQAWRDGDAAPGVAPASAGGRGIGRRARVGTA